MTGWIDIRVILPTPDSNIEIWGPDGPDRLHFSAGDQFSGAFQFWRPVTSEAEQSLALLEAVSNLGGE